MVEVSQVRQAVTDKANSLSWKLKDFASDVQTIKAEFLLEDLTNILKESLELDTLFRKVQREDP